jgi:predicted lipoprotein
MEKNKVKILKYCIGILITGIVLYHSVYFSHLDTVRDAADATVFDAKAYAENFWRNELPAVMKRAVDASELLDLFERDMPGAVEQYARTLGIASLHAYLIEGEGRIEEITENGLLIGLAGDPSGTVLIETLDLFGNAVRDASGLIDVSDFPNTMEFNTVSAEINRIVRIEIAGPALEHSAVGKNVRFTGAAEVSEDDPAINPLRIIPIEIIWKD